MKKSTKQEVVTSVFIFLWIFLINVVTPIITTAPAWPMFFVTIFFFTLGGDVKQIPSIFLSGFVGISSALVLVKLLGVLAPVMGEVPAMTLLLFIVLALIIVGGNFFPLFFNNITFAYLTICGINMAMIEKSFTSWMLMFVIGGPIILGGAMAIFALVGKAFKVKE